MLKYVANKDKVRQLLGSPGVHVHRLGMLERWILPGIGCAFFGWGGVVLTSDGDFTGWVTGLVLLVLPLSVWAILAMRVLLAYDDDQILVRNLRSRILSRADLASAVPTYEGLVLRTTDGRRFTAVAVQEYNIALMLGRKTKAAKVADDLLSR